jgi:dipeptidase E
MTSILHLFCLPGRNDIRHILEAARPYLEDKSDALVAYLPLASLADQWQEYTEKAFRGLARVETINTELMTLPEMESILRRATLAYIPGGNTFLLSHRLHLSKLMPYLRKKVQAGLPVLAFSAGTVLCGPNILTSNDLNMAETPHFAGLEATPFNFNVHYTGDPARDEWLLEYHVFHDNPMVLMADDAYVRVEKQKATLVRGEAWVWRQGQEKEKLVAGQVIPA